MNQLKRRLLFSAKNDHAVSVVILSGVILIVKCFMSS